MLPWTRENTNNLRVIKTARSANEINEAVLNGFTPLIKPVIKSEEIYSKYSIIQHKINKTIRVISDSRDESFQEIHSENAQNSEYEIIVEWTRYYPHEFPNPYAAYLIPPDIKVGEDVFVEDLIDDYVGAVWNQGCAFRLISGRGMWDGKELKIYKPQPSSLLG